MEPRDRLIVALDLPSAKEARQLVDELDGLVSFFKVGLELLMSGGMEQLLTNLTKDKQVFVDLKMPGDIPETVYRTVRLAADLGVSFLTLSHSVTSTTVGDAVRGRGSRRSPKLLYVPVLSSLDESDCEPGQFHAGILQRAQAAKNAGADGFIVSGKEIGILRHEFPDVTLVSPGIRPAGSSKDDHKRSCTPGEAIERGADYIVVGRPIRDAADRRTAAQRIINEIQSR
jgi:orotidine-5'-phosphate decarboxylase